MKCIIAGNWKMNMSPGEAEVLVKGIIDGLHSVEGDFSNFDPDVEIIVCPPFVSIAEVVSHAESSPIQVGAQNMYHEAAGAFTGEISVNMLLASGCSYVILGHSERRHVFGETDEEINKKVKAVRGTGLIPILCVGETESERTNNKTFEVVTRQLMSGLMDLVDSDLTGMIVAYEPVWAIGTGQTATPEQAQDVHAFIRDLLGKNFGEAGLAVPLLYGGSVKPKNVDALLAKADINGALVGGASLKADVFLELILAGLRKSRN